MRSVHPILLAFGAAVLALGCDSMPGRNASNKLFNGEPPEPANTEVALRVDRLGRDLLAATPLGLPEIDFQTVGSSELEICHRDSQVLFITEGLVKECKSDEELAGVLAIEMGRMTAEYRRDARRQLFEPIPTNAGAPKLDGQTNFDPSQDIYNARLERERNKPKDRKKWPTMDAEAIAREILHNAGHEERLLEDVAPLLKRAARNTALSKQLGGAGAAPKWAN